MGRNVYRLYRCWGRGPPVKKSVKGLGSARGEAVERIGRRLENTACPSTN